MGAAGRHLKRLQASWPGTFDAAAPGRLTAALNAYVAENRHDCYHDALEDVLPQLVRLIGDLAPDGPLAKEPVLLGDAIATFEALLKWLDRHGRRHRGMAARQKIADVLIGRCDAITARVRIDLDRPDHPDMRRIGLEIVKLELIEWLLEDIGQAKQTPYIRSYTGMIARQSLRRIIRVVERATADATLMPRLDIAITLAHVDELLSVATKVLDIDARRTVQESSMVAEQVGVDTVRQLLAAFSALMAVLLQEVQDMRKTGGEYRLMRQTWMLEVERIGRFCMQLRHPAVAAELDEFERMLRQRLLEMQAQSGRAAPGVA